MSVCVSPSLNLNWSPAAAIRTPNRWLLPLLLLLPILVVVVIVLVLHPQIWPDNSPHTLEASIRSIDYEMIHTQTNNNFYRFRSFPRTHTDLIFFSYRQFHPTTQPRSDQISLVWFNSVQLSLVYFNPIQFSWDRIEISYFSRLLTLAHTYTRIEHIVWENSSSNVIAQIKSTLWS